MPPSGGGIYGWWGANFAWSPEGNLFAYADADEIGLLDAGTGERTILFRFPPFYTYGEWVWVPPLSWSPDGRFLATVVHELSPQETFDLWVLGGELKVRLATQVGMWAAPLWSPEGLILFGQAEESEGSQDSPYWLYVMDGDGSNKRRLRGGLTVEELAPWTWSPWGGEVVVAQEDNLYLFDLAEGSWERITADDGASHPQWAR